MCDELDLVLYVELGFDARKLVKELRSITDELDEYRQDFEKDDEYLVRVEGRSLLLFVRKSREICGKRRRKARREGSCTK